MNIHFFSLSLIKKSIRDEVLAQVATEGACLMDSSIDFFVKLVNDQFEEEKMYYVFNYQIIENYRQYNSTEIDDVQILYSGIVQIGAVGHWICTYYKASTRKVFVYDSLNRKYVNEVQHSIISRLYPDRKGSINYVKLKIIQTDETSCGIFSIFYATTLLLGEKPENIDVKMNYVYGDPSLYMRLHILKMFANQKLALFSQKDG